MKFFLFVKNTFGYTFEEKLSWCYYDGFPFKLLFAYILTFFQSIKPRTSSLSVHALYWQLQRQNQI